MIHCKCVSQRNCVMCKSISLLYRLYKMYHKMVISSCCHSWQNKSHNHRNELFLDLIMKTESSQEQDDCENKQLCYCCFRVKSKDEERKVTGPGSQSLSSCFKVQKSTMFALQAFLVWVVLCLPGNIVTIILYQRANNLMHQVSYASCCRTLNCWSLKKSYNKAAIKTFSMRKVWSVL